MGGRKAVFLDRDGVLNAAFVRAGKPYPPSSLAELRVLPGVPEACARLKAHGYLLVGATNQPDVGRGTARREEVEQMHQVLVQQLNLDRMEVCYHPDDAAGCLCRKPRPGMLLRAADELGIDLAASFMVGDRWRDIECGQAAGCATILIDYDYAEPQRIPPDYVVKNLAEAVEIIISGTKS